MKFRSDFVTNSSSSSFTVSIKIVTKADETITLSATAGGEDNEGYLGVDFRYSPQRLAHSSSIDELLRLILDGATVTVWDDESDDEVPSHEAFWECADYSALMKSGMPLPARSGPSVLWTASAPLRFPAVRMGGAM